jgi:hypothetical protein
MQDETGTKNGPKGGLPKRLTVFGVLHLIFSTYAILTNFSFRFYYIK